MNRPSNVSGFELKILCKLSEISSFDHTHSLLMYIYSFCDKHPSFSSALQILDELREPIKAATHIEVAMLNAARDKILEKMERIAELIYSSEIEKYDICDRFVMVLTEFYQSASAKVEKLKLPIE